MIRWGIRILSEDFHSLLQITGLLFMIDEVDGPIVFAAMQQVLVGDFNLMLDFLSSIDVYFDLVLSG